MTFKKSSLESGQNTDASTSSIEREYGVTTPLNSGINKPPRDMGKLRWILTCSALYSATLLYGLDTTIVADVQVPIVERFGHIEQLTWIGAAFPLGSVAIILPLGVSYGLFDSKWLYISSFILFETGSALCGGAPSMNALIIGRVIAGMGGSGLYLGYVYSSLTVIVLV
jgi:MFS family permease